MPKPAGEKTLVRNKLVHVSLRLQREQFYLDKIFCCVLFSAFVAKKCALKVVFRLCVWLLMNHSNLRVKSEISKIKINPEPAP